MIDVSDPRRIGGLDLLRAMQALGKAKADADHIRALARGLSPDLRARLGLIGWERVSLTLSRLAVAHHSDHWRNHFATMADNARLRAERHLRQAFLDAGHLCLHDLGVVNLSEAVRRPARKGFLR